MARGMGTWGMGAWGHGTWPMSHVRMSPYPISNITYPVSRIPYPVSLWSDDSVSVVNHQRLEVHGRIPIHGDDGETALPCRSPQALWRYARYYAYGPMAYGLWPLGGGA